MKFQQFSQIVAKPRIVRIDYSCRAIEDCRHKILLHLVLWNVDYATSLEVEQWASFELTSPSDYSWMKYTSQIYSNAS